jgi:hypothetical protein
MLMSEADIEFDKEIEVIKSMFPTANFIISIPSTELNNIVSNDSIIIIKHKNDCYCYSEAPKQPNYIEVKRKPYEVGITFKNIIDTMIEYDNTHHIIDCDHNCIEGIEKISESQYEFYFGS